MIGAFFKRNVQHDVVARSKMHSGVGHIGSVCGRNVRRVVAQLTCVANDIDYVHAQACQAQVGQAQTSARALQITAEVRATGVVLISAFFKRKVQRDRVTRSEAQSGVAHGQRIRAVNVQVGTGCAAADINQVHAQGT